MTDLYTVTEFTVTLDQVNHPDLNYAQWAQYTDQELGKFMQMIMALNADYIAPQDVGGVGGLSCRFHPINGYPAVRQLTQYNPNSKSWIVWFDCRVLTKAPAEVKTDGDASVKLEPIATHEAAPAATDMSEADLQAEVKAKFRMH